MSLFSPIQLGSIELKNRIIMAPMTRGRADGNGVPKPIVADYYAQRASAGLIIAEATAVSQEGMGWVNAPGIYTDEQVAAWRKVTDAVHEKGGKIFLQIWHMGRMVVPGFLGGQQPVGASAIAAAPGEMRGPDGTPEPFVTPRALSVSEIHDRVDDFVQAARNAIIAGFDGVEIHGANGFLIEQFLRDGSNQRTDTYGGSISNRTRFLFDVVSSISSAIGAGRVGVRVTPTAQLWGLTDSDHPALYKAVSEGLNDYDLAYFHLLEPKSDAGHMMSSSLPELSSSIREWYNGNLMVNGAYSREAGEEAISKVSADMVAFGYPFIANPDLVERWQHNIPLAEADPDTFYTNDEKGFTDYPKANQ